MNNFCEECGNKLMPGDKFCEQCGAPIEQQEEALGLEPVEDDKANRDLAFSFFRDFRAKKPKKNYYYGILLTNFNNFNKKFGKNDTKTLREKLTEYLEKQRKINVYYLVLDVSDNCIKRLGNNNWKQHVNLLRKGIKRIASKLDEETHFIMLFGGDEIIPMPVFANPANPDRDPKAGDVDVDTDLPYSTLSVKNPAEKEEARSPQLPVGRIPTGSNTTVKHLLNILDNTLSCIGNLPVNKTFGLSTHSWQKVSAHINAQVGKENLYISPGLKIENVAQYYNPATNLHYFNLHGANNNEQWFGEKEGNCLPAFSPQVIAQNNSYNVIGVEACYGARFIKLATEESTLLSALATKTVSFVGSSRIAWGPFAPPMFFADIVIHDYLNLLQENWPAGDAFMKARVNAYLTHLDKSPLTGLATMMEFNLFGDPVFFMGSQSQEKSLQTGKGPREKNKLDGHSLDDLSEDELQEEEQKSSGAPSVYNLVTRAVDAAQKKITELINKKVWEKYPEFKDIEPAFMKYDFEGKTFNQLVYQKSLEYFNKYLMVNTDKEGNIIAELESK